PDGADGLDPVLSAALDVDHASADDIVRSRLSQLIPELTKLLRSLSCVLYYVLVVPRDGAVEDWTGLSSKDCALANLSDDKLVGDLVEGHPMLVYKNERVCADLWPLLQVVPPMESEDPELFVFEGRGRDGAL